MDYRGSSVWQRLRRAQPAHFSTMHRQRAATLFTALSLALAKACRWICLALFILAGAGQALLFAADAQFKGLLVTNCAQLRHMTSAEANQKRTVQMSGWITFVAPRNAWLVFQDATGGARLSPIPAHMAFKAGQRIFVQGTTSGSMIRHPRFPNSPDGSELLSSMQGPANWGDRYASRIRGYLHPPQDGEYTFWITSDDDSKLWLSPSQNLAEAALACFVRGWTDLGVWDSIPSQKSRPVFLHQGQACYLEVLHRDGDGADHLSVAWQGPGFKREVIQGKYLSPWLGTSTNISATERSLRVKTNGVITREYWTNIDLASLEDLTEPVVAAPYIANSQIRLLESPVSFPALITTVPGQSLLPLQDLIWGEVEGTVVFLSQTTDSIQIELVRSNRVMIAHLPARGVLPELLGARVRLRGVCQSVLDLLKQPVAGLLWVSDWDNLNLLPPMDQDDSLNIRILNATNWNLRSIHPGQLVKVRGRLQDHQAGERLRLREGPSEVTVSSFQTNAIALGERIEAVGIADAKSGVPVLMHAGYGLASGSSDAADPKDGPVQLRRAIQVKQLNRSEAAKAHPVHLEGVVTYNDTAAVFMQDMTGGVYVRLPGSSASSSLVAGTRIAVQGVSDPGSFAPVVVARQINVIGPSLMPVAKRHSWIQMMSGKDDAEWLEVEGIVSEYVSNRLAQLTVRVEGGPIGVRVKESLPSQFNGLTGARVRVRGVCQPIFDGDGRIQGIRLQAPSLDYLSVVTPPSDDPFQEPVRAIKSLSSFDMQTQFFRRVKVQGIATYCYQGVLFLQDESGGLQAFTSTNTVIAPGEKIEVVGFPEMKGFRPTLVSALVKSIAQGTDPEPTQATPATVMYGGYNAMLVQLEVVFLGDRTLGQQRELDLQIDRRLFRATLPATGKPWAAVPPGSRLRLTGVCLAHRDSALDFGQQPSSFEMFLRTANDLAILELPSWWTVRRALMIGGGLVMLFLAALVWISQLRRQVDRQTRELKTEIAERIRAEEEVQNIHKQLLVASRQAGMAEIAANVLHNVGNVLNSVNVSANLLIDKLGHSKASSLRKVTRMLNDHAPDLPRFLAQDEKGAKIPSYLGLLADTLETEQRDFRAELETLSRNVDHIKDIVAMQQSYTGMAGLIEKAAPSEIIEEALKMHMSAFAQHEIRIVREFEEVPLVEIDKHKVMQILCNLLDNAKHAYDESDRPDKRVTICLQRLDEHYFNILVADNGAGIPADRLLKIFSHGFSTRGGGRGFGLHYSANAAKELGGNLTASSDGLGKGAVFKLELPVKPNRQETQEPPSLSQTPKAL